MSKQSDLLANAKTLGEFLRKLYEESKRRNRKFSVQFISHKAGLPSKGYLGDVFSGRRRLNSKYAPGIANVFGLKGAEKKLFSLLVEMENERSMVRLTMLKKRLESIRAQVKGNFTDIPEAGVSQLLVSRVYCALGIFSGAPSSEEVIKLFPDCAPEEIRAVIGSLVVKGLVKESKDGLRYASREVVFDANEERKQEAHQKYLEESMDFARKMAPRWLPAEEESYFESSVVSVNAEKYKKALPRIREFFDLLQSELEEAKNADSLAYFNIQVFPEMKS